MQKINKKVSWRRIDSEYNSYSSAPIKDLDFSEWWSDPSFNQFYIHVPHKKDGSGMDDTVHRVRSKASKTPRIGMKKGRLYWLIDMALSNKG